MRAVLRPAGFIAFAKAARRLRFRVRCADRERERGDRKNSYQLLHGDLHREMLGNVIDDLFTVPALRSAADHEVLRKLGRLSFTRT